MKLFAVALFAALCLLLFAGCGNRSQTAEKAEPGPPVPAGPVPAMPEQSAPVALEPKIITYEGGLVSVSIEDGRACLFFDHDLWQQRYGMDDLDSDAYFEFREGPIPVTGLEGAVTDARVARIQSLDNIGYSGFITPVVILLTEDGSLQMTLADPYTYGENTVFESRRIPWLKDIVSLTYAADSQSEYGDDMTVYAEDAAGRRYNVRIPGSYSFIMDKELYCSMPYIDEWPEAEGDYMTVTLSSDGTAIFQKFWAHDERCELYQGTYEVQAEEEPAGGRPPAGAVSFDLALNWWIYERGKGDISEEDAAFWDAGQSLDGVYLSWVDCSHSDGVSFYLTFFEGKGLLIYKDNRPADEYLTFYSDKDRATG